MKLTLKRLIAVLISFCLTLNMNGLVLAETELEGTEGSEVTEEIPEAIFQEETLETITFEEETVEPVEEVQEQVEVTEETPIENTEVIPEETVSEETKVTETTENTEVVENPEESEQSEETEGSEIASEETVDTEGMGADTPEVFEKTVYEYDDQYMRVTATLESADALSDSAKVEVAEIIDAERDLYLQALNTNSEFEYTVDNTVVFDIAFKAEAKDADGKVITGQWEEVKPSKGSVQLKVEFKDAKLSNGLGIVDSEDAALIHMPLNSGIKTPTTMYDIALDDLTDKDTTVIILGATDVVEAKVEGFSAFAFVNTKVEEEVVEEEEEVVEEEVRTKTVYEYSDEDIHVTATFDYAEDMPDDAVFTVKGMDVNPYLNILNADSDVFEYTVDNTLVYDFEFMANAKDENDKVIEGEFVEYQPEQGAVKFDIEFNKAQLSTGLETEYVKDVKVFQVGETATELEATAVLGDIDTVSATVNELGTIAIANASEDEVRIKRVYVYDDAKVRVTATLQYATAVPDNAEFRVTELTGEIRNTYMQALNANAGEIAANSNLEETMQYNDENTLLYDMAFMVNAKDEEGNVIEGQKVEYQPEEGSVTINVKFKEAQISSGLGAESPEEVTVVHMPLAEEVKEEVESTLEANAAVSDIQIEVVSDNTNLGGVDSTTITLDNFSVTAIISNKEYKGGSLTINNTKNAFLNPEYAQYRNDLSPIGAIAGSFHIVAFDTAELKSHTNGNILATNLKAYSNFGTNEKTEGKITELSYIQNYIDVNNNSGATDAAILVLGSGMESKIGTMDNGQSLSINGTKLDRPDNIIVDANTSTAPFIDINEVKNQVLALNSSLASIPPQGATVDILSDQNNRKITVTTNGAAYVTLKASDLMKYSSNPIKIEGLKKTTSSSLIINVDCEGKSQVEIASEMKVYVNGVETTHSETVDFSTGLVAWNFYNTGANTLIKINNYFGQMIAPTASIEANNGNGNLIAKNVKPVGETHRHDFKGDLGPGGTPTVSVPLKVTKAVSGDNYTGNEKFNFTLSDANPAGTKGYTMPSNTTASATNGNTATFGDIKFTQDGTYTFKIKETKGSASGMSYDIKDKYAQVVVSKKTSGSGFDTTVTYGSDSTNISATSLTITNTYEAPNVPVDLKINKTLNVTSGEYTLNEDFKFTVTAIEGDSTGYKLTGGTEATAKNGGTATFDTIKFTKTGTYYFKIQETSGNTEGMTYDSSAKYAKVNVSKDYSGKFSAQVTYGTTYSATGGYNRNNYSATSISANNTYSQPKASIPLAVTKRIDDNSTGTYNLTDSYTFTLTDVTGNDTNGYSMPANKTASAVKDATATFDEITFTKAGTYYFTITETGGNKAGVTYDTAAKYAVVSVTSNTTTGKLEASVKYGTSKTGANSDSLTITNEYTQPTASITLGVSKTVDVQSGTYSKNEDFTFTLADANTGKTGYVMPTENDDLSKTIKNGGSATFGAITFTKADTYTFTITETAGNTSGMQYDATPKYAVVTVSDDGTGALSASVKYGNTTNDVKAGPLTVKNTYNQPTTSIDLGVGKTVNVISGTYSKNEDFTFTLAEVAGNDTTGYSMTGVSTTATVKNGATASFGTVTFTKAGTYNFTITESSGSTEGMDYTTTPQYAVVTVSDDGTGALSSSVKYGTDKDNPTSTTLIVTNDYTQPTIPVTLGATKAITEIPAGSYDIGETFTFTLAADADNDTTGYAMTTDVVKTAQKGGSVSFGQITFSKAGDYYFTITESTGSTPGMSYASVKYAKVKVTSDANGKLSVETTYGDSKDKTTSPAPFTITNTYTRPTTQVELKVTKNLTQDPANSYDANEDFTFTLGEDSSNNKNGYAMPTNLTKTTKEGGTATFDAITFKLPGTYYFTIKESKGSTPGMDYDESTNYAKVVVNKANDGTLSATTTYGADKDNAGNGSLAVTNDYTQPKTTLELPVKKVLDVKPAGSYSGSDTFTFTITNGYAITNTANGGMTLPTNMTTSTTAGGTAKFDAITFTKPGEYMLIINESQGSNPDITYDTSDKKVKIKVEQDDTGALSASVVGVYDKDDKGQGTELEITNKYVSPTTPLQLSAGKTVTQSPANSYSANEDFTFTLGEDDPNATGYTMPGTTSKTVKNGGTVTFDAITFSAEGTFYFTITESNGTTHGMTYDVAPKYVKVDVTKDADGVLVPVATYSDKKDGTYGNSLTITNSYTKPETSVTLNVKKVVDDAAGDYTADENFTFTLSSANADDKGGYEMPTAAQLTKTAKNGAVASFGAIKFTEEGTYYFKIKESSGSTHGMTYDTADKYAIVTITKSGTTFASSVKYGTTTNGNGDDLTVTNTYTKPKVTVTPKVKKVVSDNPTGSYTANEDFTFTLAEVAGNDKTGYTMGTTTATTKKGAEATFGDITFTKEGTYNFTIKESSGSTHGMTYDTADKYFKVVVEKDNNTFKATPTYGTDSSNVSGTDLTVTNTYGKPQANVGLSVKKTIDGTYNGTEEFEFVLADANDAGTDGYTMPTNKTKKAAKNQTATFDNITFTEAGTYYFTIKENSASTAGMTYNGKTYYATVKITASGNSFASDVKYGEAKDGTATSLEIENSYTKPTITVQPAVTKAVSGTYSGTEAFSFTLSDANDEGKQGYTMPTSGLTQTAIKDATATFPAITFDTAGEYYFKIKETAGNTAGMTYTTSDRFMKVTVSADANGNLSRTFGYGESKETATAGSLTITNSYGKPTIEVKPEVTKSVSGTYNGGETFNFTLADDNDAGKQGYSMPQNTSASATNGNKATFDAITFDEAGTYYFTITETGGSTHGMTYDEVAKSVKVVVSKADNGALSKVVTYGADKDKATDTDLTITNSYTKPETSVTLKVKKDVDDTPTGSYKANEDFTFTLASANAATVTGYEMPDAAGLTKTIKDGATASFDAIKFTAEGTYYFTITETGGSTHGMTYDTAAKYAIVTITKSGNTFAKTVTYGTTTAGTDDELKVTNTYNKPNIDVDLSVGKTVTADPTGSYTDDEDFTFTLGEDSGNDKDGYTMPTDKTASTKQNGTATFDSINFVKEGTYIFTIKENKGSTHGMTYDQSENYAKVVIEKNGDTFKKTVTFGSDKTNIAAGSLSVNNDYKKPEGSVVLKATKKISGTYTGSETFTFTMSEDDPTAKGYIFPTTDLVQTVSKNGTASFGEIKFTAAGTYYFKITETAGSTIGMTYDTNPKIAKVVVEANGGSFKTTVTYGEDKNAASDNLDITNKFFLSRVKISKVDVADDSELAGATLGIYDSTGTNLVQMLDETTQTYVNATWTSGTDVKEVVGLAAGTYVLRETVAPTGYAITSDITFTLDDAGNVTSTAKNNDGVILVKDSKTSVKITKVDITSHKEIDGAHIQLIDNTGTIVDQWDSTGTPKEIKGLATGVTYTLRETTAPNGYAITTDTTFILNDDGSIDTTNSTTTVGNGTNGPDGVLLVEDGLTSISISKVDVTSHKEIDGAHIQIIEGTTVVKEWNSSKDGPETITGLKTGVEYILRETIAPNGYKTTTDTKFKLNADGTIDRGATDTTIGDGTDYPSGSLIVEDALTAIKITKVDIANGAEISGAHIQILEGTDIIEQWDSTGVPKDIVGLKTGVEYTLRETTAPDGYTITTDTKFKLKADGSIDDTVTTTHIGDGTTGPNGVLLVEDAMTSIKISKVDITDGAEVAGAHIEILEGETVVRYWDSDGSPKEITGLKTGVEYTLRETIAPTGYTIATDTKFKINTDGTIDSSSTTKVGDGTIGPNGVLLVQDDLIYIDIEGAKTWSDANNQDNKRPASITIHLSADGTEVANKTVTATDKWKWKFEHLPEYNKGKKIVYTITEDTVSSYNSVVTGYNVENSYTPGLVQVNGSKNWDDNGNQDGIRPTAITIRLLADNTEIDSKVVTGPDWSWSWSNLPEYNSGKKITYTITEDNVTGYSTEITGYNVKNSHTPATVSVAGKKTWVDPDDTKRPNSIKIRLYADGTEIDSKDVTSSNNWEYSFTNLPKYKKGTEIKYTVSEDAISNYVATQSGNDFKNTITSVKISKVDATSQAEVEGAHIQVLEGTNVVEEWNSGLTAHEIKGLKKGVTYTLRETVAPTGYAITTDTTFVINDDGSVSSTGSTSTDGTLLVEDDKTSIQITKVDINNGAEVAGAHIQILEGTTVVKEWDSQGTPETIVGLKTGVTYTLRETSAPNGYKITSDTKFELNADGTVNGGKTTTHIGNGTTGPSGVLLVEDDVTSVKISKVDATSQQEVAGAHIQVLDDKSNIVDEWDSLTTPHEIKGLLTDVTYTLRETVAPTGYAITTDTTFVINKDGTVSSTGTISSDGRLLVEDDKTVVKISKVDATSQQEVAGAHIKVIDDQGTVVDEWDSGKTAHEIKGLKTNVTYTLSETVAPDGYAVTTDTTFVINPNGSVTSTGSKSSDGTLLVEDDKTSVKVSKVDVNNGKEVAGAHIQIIDKNSKVVEEWDSTTTPHEIKGLITGETYILRETTAPTGYVTTTDTTFILNADGSVDTINSTTKLGDGTYGKNGVLLVEDDLIRTSVAGTKTWTDKLNQDNKRPTSITIRLYADGNEIDHKVVTATDNWSWNWTNLPEYNNGKKIEYKISEDTVDGYTSIVTGFNVENKYTPDQVQVQGNKDWDDNNNQDGIRPTTITVRLFANGNEIDHKDVTANDNWEWNWTGLDKNSNGQPIAYTVKEDTITDYNTVITGYNIKNSHGPATVTVSGTKTWDDAVDVTKRPASITIRLYADGKEIDYKTVTANDFWSWTWSGLDKYQNGQEIKYTVSEDPVKGYITTQSGYDFTNTITTVKVSKVDVTNDAELDGASIQVIDSKNQIFDSWISSSQAPHTIAGLVIGETYTLRETVAPNGYTLATDTTFVVNADGSVTTLASKTQDGVLLIKDAKTVVKISKVDVTSKQEVDGAHIQIIDKTNTVVKEWDSKKNGGEVIEGLKAGETYTLRETIAPDGYTIAADTTFFIDVDGNVTTTGSMTQDGILLVEDAKTKVKISKVDVTTQQEVEKAHIQIIDDQNNVVKEWDSKKNGGEEIEGLKTGITYTLRETVAPEGYTIATDTTFFIDTTGKVTSTGSMTQDGILLVEDAKTSVKISKVDATSQQELPGAHIQIIDANSNVVEEWDSTTTPHEIKGLKTKEEYTLRETVAPDGYSVATDTKFTIDEKGKVSHTGSTTQDGILLVEDWRTNVKISKVDLNNGAEIAGATIEIYDETGAKLQQMYDVATGKYVDAKWVSTGTTKDVIGLKANATYVLKETVAPTGYAVTSDTKFTIKADGTIDPAKTTTVTGNGTNGPAGVLLVQDDYAPDKVALAGKKTWNDNDNSLGLRPKEIYIHLYNAKDMKNPIDTMKVDATNGWSWKFVGLPKYDKGKIIMYTITETDAQGNPIAGYNATNACLVSPTDTVYQCDITNTPIHYSNSSSPAIYLNKKAADGSWVTGATLQVEKIGTNWSVLIQNTGTSTNIVNLNGDGQYRITEVVTPAGYATAAPIDFTLSAGQVKEFKNNTIDMIDDVEVVISKEDIAGKEIKDAELKVTGANISPIIWKTDGINKTYISLAPGSYTLTETTAPQGYLKAESIDFTVSIDASGKPVITVGKNTVNEIVMVDLEETKPDGPKEEPKEEKPEEKPKSNNPFAPNTGDESNMGGWMTTLFGSLFGMLVALFAVKKKEDSEN